jgi:hypothetical protein
VPDDTLVESTLKRFGKLKDLRSPCESYWKDVTDFALPRRSFWDLDEEEGKRPSQRLFNTRAGLALETLATGIVGYSVSPSVAWFRLRLADFDLQKLPYVADWLEDCERRMYAEFQRSTFYAQAIEYVADAASIGHATMFVRDASRRVIFSTRHPKEIYIANAPDGSVDTVFREFRPTALALKKSFGEEALNDHVRKILETDPDRKIRILHAVFPREEREYGRLDAKNKPWASLYVDLESHEVINESGFEEKPYAVTRWRTNSDETYGRSPAQDCLADVMMLQQVTRTRLNLAQLVGDPPYNVPDSLRGRERLVPHGYNYYTSAQETVSAVAVGGNYPITADVENRIEDIVNKHFHVDFFLMLSQAEKPMTAREIVERQGEKAAILGASIGRINQEFLTPVVERTFKIMMRQGRLPPPPQVLVDEDASFEIDFVGPLAQAQKKYHQTAGLLQSLDLVGPIAQLDPTAMDNIDADALMREALDAFQMPQKAIREEPEVKKIRAARAQQQAQAQQQQLALLQRSETLKNLDKLNKQKVPGSFIDELDQQLQGAGAPAGGAV